MERAGSRHGVAAACVRPEDSKISVPDSIALRLPRRLAEKGEGAGSFKLFFSPFAPAPRGGGREG
jgi:hypothetical protein